MIISAGTADWEKQLSAAFKRRIQFELGQIDKLNLSHTELFKLVSAWSVQWHYTPKMTGDTSIEFRPNELPDESSLWNTPKPKITPDKQA